MEKRMEGTNDVVGVLWLLEKAFPPVPTSNQQGES